MCTINSTEGSTVESDHARVKKYFLDNFSCTELPMRHDALTGPFFDSSLVRMSGCCGGMDGDYPVWSTTPSTSIAAMLKPQKQKEFKKQDNAHDESESNIQFTPRVYVQRYQAVVDVLLGFKGDLKKVLDLGCGDGSFIKRFLREPSRVKHLVGLDIDESELATAVKLLGPTFENRMPLPSSLNDLNGTQGSNPSKTVELFQGSALVLDARLLDADAVVMIEVIEHLYEKDLPSLVQVVFGHIRPSLVVLTTPNADFNHFFHMSKDQFRHWDHKYEWTRRQFSDWCNSITTNYPEYIWEHQGVAKHPDGIESSGCCTQMAIFTRSDRGKIPTVDESDALEEFDVNDVAKSHKLTDSSIAAGAMPYIQIAHIYYPTEEQLSLREHQLKGALQSAIADIVEATPDSNLRWVFKKQGVDVEVEALFNHLKVRPLCHSLFQVCMALDDLGYQVRDDTRSVFHVIHQEYSSSESTSSGPEWGE